MQNKFDYILDYLKHGWFQSPSEWATAFRRDLPTWGHNTNNICEGNFFAAKFVIFKGIRAFNLFQLVCTISSRYDAHYSDRIVRYVNKDFDMEVRTGDKREEGREGNRQGGSLPGGCVFDSELKGAYSSLFPFSFFPPPSLPAQVFIKEQLRRHTKRWKKQDKSCLDLHDFFRLYDVTPLPGSSTLFIVKRKKTKESDEVESEHQVDLEAGCCTCLKGGTKEMCVHISATLHHKPPAGSTLILKHAANCSPEQKDLYLMIARGEAFMKAKCWAWALPAGEHRDAYLALEAEREKKEIAAKLLKKDAEENEANESTDDAETGGGDGGQMDDDDQNPTPLAPPPSKAPPSSPAVEPSPIKFNGQETHRLQFVYPPSPTLLEGMKRLGQRAEKKEYCGGAPLNPVAKQVLDREFKDPEQRRKVIGWFATAMPLQDKIVENLEKEAGNGFNGCLGVHTELAMRKAAATLKTINTPKAYMGKNKLMKTQKGGKNPLPPRKRQKTN